MPRTRPADDARQHARAGCGLVLERTLCRAYNCFERTEASYAVDRENHAGKFLLLSPLWRTVCRDAFSTSRDGQWSCKMCRLRKDHGRVEIDVGSSLRAGSST